MKFNSDNIAIIIGFVIVIVLILIISGLNSYVPYSTPYSSFLKGSEYEGFNGAPYSTVREHSNIDNPVDVYSIAPTKPSANNMRGFDGLFAGPNANEDKLDRFLQLPGSLTCGVGSMSNSKGYLCLGPDELKLLTTRGGNAAGNNFEQTAK